MARQGRHGETHLDDSLHCAHSRDFQSHILKCPTSNIRSCVPGRKNNSDVGLQHPGAWLIPNSCTCLFCIRSARSRTAVDAARAAVCNSDVTAYFSSVRRPRRTCHFLVRLNFIPIKLRGGGGPDRIAELDKLFVFGQCERFTRQLSPCDALHGGRVAAQKLKHGTVPAFDRVEPIEFDAEGLQMFEDEAVMLCLVSRLAGQPQFDVDLGCGRHPDGSEFAGFEFVLQRHFEPPNDLIERLDARCRGVGFPDLPQGGHTASDQSFQFRNKLRRCRHRSLPLSIRYYMIQAAGGRIVPRSPWCNPASYRDRGGAGLARREEGAYSQYVTDEQRRPDGMHRRSNAAGVSPWAPGYSTGCRGSRVPFVDILNVQSS